MRKHRASTSMDYNFRNMMISGFIVLGMNNLVMKNMVSPIRLRYSSTFIAFPSFFCKYSFGFPGIGWCMTCTFLFMVAFIECLGYRDPLVGDSEMFFNSPPRTILNLSDNSSMKMSIVKSNQRILRKRQYLFRRPSSTNDTNSSSGCLA